MKKIAAVRLLENSIIGVAKISLKHFIETYITFGDRILQVSLEGKILQKDL